MVTVQCWLEILMALFAAVNAFAAVFMGGGWPSVLAAVFSLASMHVCRTLRHQTMSHQFHREARRGRVLCFSELLVTPPVALPPGAKLAVYITCHMCGSTYTRCIDAVDQLFKFRCACGSELHTQITLKHLTKADAAAPFSLN